MIPTDSHTHHNHTDTHTHKHLNHTDIHTHTHTGQEINYCSLPVTSVLFVKEVDAIT